MVEGFRIRLATLDDVPTIVHHRHAMFAEMGTGTVESRQAMNEGSEIWLRDKIACGDYLGFLVVNGADTVVAGAGLWLMDWIPGPLDIQTRRAYILNVYTEPDYRGRGLARWLVTSAMDWSREHGLNTVLLHASDAGRPIYESLGFTASTEMRLMFSTPS